MAYCCGKLTGIAEQCVTEMAGINSVFIACWQDVQKPTLGTTGEITSIIGSPNGATPVWKVYHFQSDTSNVVSTGTRQNGNASVSSVVTLQIQGITAVALNEINELRKSGLAIIAEFCSGVYTYFGFYRPCFLTGDVMNSGTAFSDFQGFDLTFTENSMEYPYILSKAAVTQLIGTGA
jgi:hypothetical protein